MLKYILFQNVCLKNLYIDYSAQVRVERSTTAFAKRFGWERFYRTIISIYSRRETISPLGVFPRKIHVNLKIMASSFPAPACGRPSSLFSFLSFLSFLCAKSPTHSGHVLKNVCKRTKVTTGIYTHTPDFYVNRKIVVTYGPYTRRKRFCTVKVVYFKRLNSHPPPPTHPLYTCQYMCRMCAKFTRFHKNLKSPLCYICACSTFPYCQFVHVGKS